MTKKLVYIDVLRAGSCVGRVEYLSRVKFSVVEPRLQLQFGPGSLSPADSERVQLLPADQLEPGKRYLYKIFPPAGSQAPQPPPQQKRVRIHIPPTFYDDDYVTIDVRFKNAEHLKEFLRCAQVPGLLEVADDTTPTLVSEFAELVDGGVYTHAPCSKEAFARLQGEARHLQQAREDELCSGVLHHTQQTEPDQDLCNLPNPNKPTQEDDVIFVGTSAAWVGSHKAHVKGVKPVKQIAERAKELGKLPNQPPSCMKPASMVQRAGPDVEQKLDAVCQDLQVARFKQTGRAIQPVNSMAAVGRQQLLKF